MTNRCRIESDMVVSSHHGDWDHPYQPEEKGGTLMTPQSYCQSCSMPICKEELKGTRADGAPSDDFCTYCYQKGAFVQDVTMAQMIEICVPHMVNSGMPEKEARTLLETTLPNLARWRKG